MSEPRIAALVCEGQTDVPILRAALQEVWPELDDVRCLQPELDALERAKGPGGWSQVKAWCERHAENLAEVLDPDIGDRIDLLVVAIDVDIAIDAGIADPPKKKLGRYETKRLRDTIRGWLVPATPKKLPAGVVLSTPVMAIEAWIIAALFRNEKSPETIADPAGWLVRKKKLERSPRDNKPWKELHLYKNEFAPKIARALPRVRTLCAEAERTLHEVEQRRRQLARR